MKTLTTILAILSFALCVALGLGYGDLYSKINTVQEDSISSREVVMSEVNEALDEYFNPTFESTAEAHTYATTLLELKGMQEEFLSIPEDVLLNVTTVLINQNGVTNIPEILNAYNSNQAIYDNLPKQPKPDSIRVETVYVQVPQLSKLETPPSDHESNSN